LPPRIFSLDFACGPSAILWLIVTIKRRAEIDLFTKIITAFEVHVQRYLVLRREVDKGKIELLGKMGSYYNTHKDEHEFQSMFDLVSMPVTSWPTLEIYAEFKKCWVSTKTMMQLGDIRNTERVEFHAQLKKTRDDSIVTLMKLLQDERTRLGDGIHSLRWIVGGAVGIVMVGSIFTWLFRLH
jgi:hypothetical protein